MADPLRPPDTDEEPWTVTEEPDNRSWSLYAVLACIGIGALVVVLAYLGADR